MVVPQIADGQALVLAVGIIGATVMPHAVYLHSGLTQARIPPRNEAEKRRLVRISNHEVIATLAVAGLVNIAMVLMASAAFHSGHPEVAEIETAYHTLIPLLGGTAAGVGSAARAAGRWVPAFPTELVRGLKAHGRALVPVRHARTSAVRASCIYGFLTL